MLIGICSFLPSGLSVLLHAKLFCQVPPSPYGQPMQQNMGYQQQNPYGQQMPQGNMGYQQGGYQQQNPYQQNTYGQNQQMPQNNAAFAQPASASWTCDCCGNVNEGAFCTGCGNRKG